MEPNSIRELATRDGGVVSRQLLLRAGFAPRRIDDLRRRGDLIVIRRGWYRLPGAVPSVVATTKAGGIVTCVSALPYHHSKIWIPPGPHHVHRRFPSHRSRRRVAHCRAYRPLPPTIRAIDTLPNALRCAANCLSADMLVAVLDSVLRIPGLADLSEVFRGAPRRITRLLSLLDARAESGTESITRYRLHCAHIKTRSQVVIPHVGRVDLLVGDKLIIECDSDGHHGGDQRRDDLRRDRMSTRGDYRTMRIDYRDVLYDWESVLDDIRTIVRTDRHLGKCRF